MQGCPGSVLPRAGTGLSFLSEEDRLQPPPQPGWRLPRGEAAGWEVPPGPLHVHVGRKAEQNTPGGCWPQTSETPSRGLLLLTPRLGRTAKRRESAPRAGAAGKQPPCPGERGAAPGRTPPATGPGQPAAGREQLGAPWRRERLGGSPRPGDGRGGPYGTG